MARKGFYGPLKKGLRKKLQDRVRKSSNRTNHSYTRTVGIENDYLGYIYVPNEEVK